MFIYTVMIFSCRLLRMQPITFRMIKSCQERLVRCGDACFFMHIFHVRERDRMLLNIEVLSYSELILHTYARYMSLKERGLYTLLNVSGLNGRSLSCRLLGMQPVTFRMIASCYKRLVGCDDACIFMHVFHVRER